MRRLLIIAVFSAVAFGVYWFAPLRQNSNFARGDRSGSVSENSPGLSGRRVALVILIWKHQLTSLNRDICSWKIFAAPP